VDTARTVLTAIGRDRPGLVEEVAEFFLERGGNIEESRMANLLGQFAIAVLVSGTTESIERIAADADALRAQTGLELQLTPVASERPAPSAPGLRFRGQALDEPGLVHEVADVFRNHGANIESLATTIEPAPVTGAPVFTIEAVVSATDADALAAALAPVCARLDITWELDPAS
jgi:glycine cleavage system transcriptional repressor